MPNYTIDIIGVTGTAWQTFTSQGVVGTITFSDEDTLGVGDNNPDTETGALPVIVSVTGTLPASWVGQTLSFGWQQQIDGSGGPDALGMVIGGGSNFISTHLVQYPGGTTIVTGTTYTASGIENVPTEIVVCYAAGARIRTPSGNVAVEELAIGDMVETLDNGPQDIKWIGSSPRFARGELAPVVFRKGAIGNAQEFRVSPQHRMLISGWQAELLFDAQEVLVPAVSLVNETTIQRDYGGMVEYYHFLLDGHQIVFVEDVPSESLYLGEQALDAHGENSRKEILRIFPELNTCAYQQELARPSLRRYQGEVLSATLAGSGQNLLS